MQQAARPIDEAARLAELKAYEILDTLPEQAYDDLTYIASQLCGTPIALVSLVDEERQWFKSRVGLDVEHTPRALAFCAHAILDPSSLCVVEDARKDQRFVDNPLVTEEPGIRFYAGAPLVTAAGHALGTLCVIDREPRHLSAQQREGLCALSRQVVARLELRRAVKQMRISSGELRASNQALDRRSAELERSRDALADLCHELEDQADVIERDLHRAEIIQRSLLPHEAPRVRNFSVQTLYQPGRNIGGDLYDVVGMGSRYVGLVVADASGHGVSAAMLSVLFKHRLRLAEAGSGRPYPPAEVLARINTQLCADLPAPGVFVTAVVGLLDSERRELRLASAGHTPALLLSSDGSLRQVEHTGPALGLYPGASYTEQLLPLETGDRLLLYTDGLLDAGEVAPEPAGIAARLHALGEDEQVLDSLLAELTGGKPRRDCDDVTMLLARAAPGPSRFQGSPRRLETEPPRDERAASPITYAETPSGTYVALQGRVGWMHSSGLLEAASSVLEAGRPLAIDLARCEHLDSTLLGTLHEIVERADQAGVPVRLHTAGDRLRAAFEELSMQKVLACIDATALAEPPESRPLELPETDTRRQQLRLLKAHEALAELSEENRKVFAEVVAALRSDIAKH